MSEGAEFHALEKCKQQNLQWYDYWVHIYINILMNATQTRKRLKGS